MQTALRFYPSTSRVGLLVPESATFGLRPFSGQIHLCSQPKPQLAAAAGLLSQAFNTARSIMGPKDGFQVSPSDRWWNEKTTAIVTGANKGIGKATAQILAQNGLITIAASRDESRGIEAVEDLKKSTGSDQIMFEQLDISDEDSVKQFAGRIKEKHSNVAILINNAGLAYKGNTFGAQEARNTLDTNFMGTKAVCEALVPLLEGSKGRIVNVCSSAGKRRIIKDKQLLQRFDEAQSVADVEKLADEYVEGIKADDFKSKGWPGSMYGVSKLCEAAYTRVLAKQLESRVDVNACCPGYVSTDMTSHRGYKTPLSGADTPAWLALLAPKGTTGKFFSERSEEAF